MRRILVFAVLASALSLPTGAKLFTVSIRKDSSLMELTGG